jgi:hypothetical protein
MVMRRHSLDFTQQVGVSRQTVIGAVVAPGRTDWWAAEICRRGDNPRPGLRRWPDWLAPRQALRAAHEGCSKAAISACVFGRSAYNAGSPLILAGS